MRSNIQNGLEDLSYTDIYSLILFALYKMQNEKDYSTLSELVYLLDYKSLYNLLDYFGGMTIKIPTKKELEIVIYALLLYQAVQLEGQPMSENLIKDINLHNYPVNEIQNAYIKICEILRDYDFKRN